MRLVLLGADGPRTAALADAAIAAGALVERVTTDDATSPSFFQSCALLDLDAQGHDFSRDLERVRDLSAAGVPVVVAGQNLTLDQAALLFEAGARDVIGAPLHKRELVLRLSALLRRLRRVACIGGGTGLYTVLSGLKDDPRVLLSSIVTMSDDGGSSGRLRTSLGILPPGDVRRSLVALSNAPNVMNFVMQYRFAGGDGLSGHSLGNLLLAALSEYTGGIPSAVKALGDVLNVHGLVMCVTEQATTLAAEFEDGRVVRGESAIDRCLERPAGLRIQRVWQEPPTATSVDVFAALAGADLIVVGPGDLYTSVLSALIVDGVARATRASRAKRVYVANLMTKPGETEGYDVADHVAAVEGALGHGALDFVVASTTVLDPDAVQAYAREGQHPVAIPSAERFAEVTRAELVARDVGDRADLVRHDGAKLRAVLMSLLCCA